MGEQEEGANSALLLSVLPASFGCLRRQVRCLLGANPLGRPLWLSRTNLMGL